MRLTRTAAGAAPRRMQQCAFGREPDSRADRSGVAEPTAAPSSGTSEEPSADQGVVGTGVRFTAGDAVVQVVIDEDNPTTRSFLAMLPMTLEFSDYGGKEKVATPTGEWNFTGAKGLNPEVGDLFSYMPWGNLGFFYNTAGNTFSNDLTKIGKTEDIDWIKLLDGQRVTLAVAG
ncbi:cyclophilin-like fold protein [Arthrobacter sp. Marseille-P9274]|uniref:cyclophilin-like fold protein n=1 Tax=Arthrobacter sp. Marseille-P9274 TaxID=2866572 RepID=UPI0021CA0FD6|nr:cyclophilin-like fold protein [Arthrobacter sp. Marseille-P9274]